MTELIGKVFIITGGASGIVLATLALDVTLKGNNQQMVDGGFMLANP